jgi:hypothetical protein
MSGGGLQCLLFFYLTGASPMRRCQQVHHQGQRPNALEKERDDSPQQAALGMGGLGDRHHQGDVDPGNSDKVHGELTEVSEVTVALCSLAHTLACHDTF